MNIPSVFRKALDGFIIPPRTYFQMFVSAAQGAMGMMNEEQRKILVDRLDKSIISEEVISQATAAPLIMLSLHHDLSNPLFQRHKFDALEFLSGAELALEQFHNVAGALENQLHSIQDDANKLKSSSSSSSSSADEEKEKETPITSTNEASATEKSSATGSTKEEEYSATTTTTTTTTATTKEEETREAIISTFPSSMGNFFAMETNDKGVAAVLEHEWMDDAEKDPESLAGQLSRMITKELFHSHQLTAKTAFLLQNHAQKVSFKEGSCTVNNVALLSARSFVCLEREEPSSSSSSSSSSDSEVVEWGEPAHGKYDIVDYETGEKESTQKKGGVAAQLEVLYDVTQEFVTEALPEGSKEAAEDQPESIETTIVSVAVMEGWLDGGPGGELRWRLALHRPAFEFPGIQ